MATHYMITYQCSHVGSDKITVVYLHCETGDEGTEAELLEEVMSAYGYPPHTYRTVELDRGTIQ